MTPFDCQAIRRPTTPVQKIPGPPDRMVLDQQIPLEWAFAGPAELRRRLGAISTAQEIARWTPSPRRAFSARPRCTLSGIDGDPGAGAVPHARRQLRRQGRQRLEESRVRHRTADPCPPAPGFGDQKAKIFVALLGKQLGVRAAGWQRSPPRTAIPRPSAPWPTSPTPPLSTGSAPSSRT